MTDLTKPTRVAHINVIVEIPDDVSVEQVEVDLTAALNGTRRLSGQRATRVFIAGMWHPLPRFVWRGSNASGELLEDLVNNIDDHTTRAGASYAVVTCEFDAEVVGYAGDVIRVDRSARCMVDAYDGRHILRPGDTLVMTVDGWTVEAAS